MVETEKKNKVNMRCSGKLALRLLVPEIIYCTFFMNKFILQDH